MVLTVLVLLAYLCIDVLANQMPSIRGKPYVQMVQHARPVPAGRPNRRPLVRPQARPPVFVRPRPPHHKVIIMPVLHPMPIYNIKLHHQPHHKPVNMSNGTCINQKGESIFSHCQTQAAHNFDLQSQNETWAVCCEAYMELNCYKEKAAEYCSMQDRQSLVDHSQSVANYFNATICRGVAYKNMMTSCQQDKHLEESRQFLKEATEKNLRPHFIEVPKAVGLDQTCFDTLRNHSQGNWKGTCLKASLDIWDPDRKRLKNSYIYEACCGMVDALNW